MRSSRQKLKLLRSLGGNCPNGNSQPICSHHHLQHIHHPHSITHSISNTKDRSASPISTTASSPVPRQHQRTLRSKNSESQQPAVLTPSFKTNSNIPTPTGGRRHSERSNENTNGIVGGLVFLPKMDTVGLTTEVKVKAFNICRDYLHGAWKEIDLRDLGLKRVSGGLSNYLYHCSLPSTLTPLGNEPTQVLLRFYGQVHGEDALESLITESVIFTLLSERKLGPKLYGVFPGGRIEQFLPARPLQTLELRDPGLSRLIAQKMAQIHALNIPISKEASWLWGTMGRWMANIRENLSKMPVNDLTQNQILLKMSNYNLEEELKWLRNFLPQVGSPVVFSHNDLQEGNILLRPEYETLDEKLVLIDFEYCSYNYRGFDLANHFCEWSFNYQLETYPNFTHIEADLPSEEEQLRFIRDYLRILRLEFEQSFGDLHTFETSPMFNEEHIMKEVKAFTLASHFFWTLWAVVNAQVSKIPFGYWEYGLTRLETYLRLKQHFV